MKEKKNKKVTHGISILSIIWDTARGEAKKEDKQFISCCCD